MVLSLSLGLLCLNGDFISAGLGVLGDILGEEERDTVFTDLD